MSDCPFYSRRGFLGTAGSLIAASALAGRTAAEGSGNPPAVSFGTDERVAFYGLHQAGIDTPRQKHTVFAALDLITDQVSEIIRILEAWTEAASRLTTGQTAEMLIDDPSMAPRDSGETLGMTPRRLTVTFGFGPGLFEKEGKDRYRLKQSGQRRWSICHGSMGSSSMRSGAAAIFAFRPAPTMALWLFAPSANWCGWRRPTMRRMAMAARSLGLP